MARTVKRCLHSRHSMASKKHNGRRQRETLTKKRKQRMGSNAVRKKATETCDHSNLDKQTDCQRGERRYGASHQGQTINKWKEDNMFEAIKEFKAQKETAECERLSVRGIARA